MPTKKNNYIGEDLDWLEAKAEEIKTFIDNTSYSGIEDRIVDLQTAMGGSNEKVAATKEAIQKSYREALKEYASIIEVINNLREKEAAKIETRGKQELSLQAKKFLTERR